MKILHMVSGIDPQSGGPTRSVTGLCRALAQAECDTTLFVHSPQHAMPNPSGVYFFTGKGMKIQTMWQDAVQVLNQVKPDLIHLHGLWSPSHHIDACVARKFKIPYIIAPRGMLEPWSLDQKIWKKKLAMFLYQKKDLMSASALHATAESEALQFRNLGFNQPIIISPNGVTLPTLMPKKNYRKDNKRVILFISRIHPKKGMMELVEAWARLKHDPNLNKLTGEWHLEYAGPDSNGHLAVVQKRMQELGVERDFTYLGMLDDTEKWVVYRRADMFVLPTYCENFGIVIAEALAASVPVITTKGTPWVELQGSSGSAGVRECASTRVDASDGACVNTVSEISLFTLHPSSFAASGRCGWWVDIGVDPLVQALQEAISLSDEDRTQMGQNGCKLVTEKYSWPAIAEDMKVAYEWLANKRDVPHCVRLDGFSVLR